MSLGLVILLLVSFPYLFFFFSTKRRNLSAVYVGVDVLEGS